MASTSSAENGTYANPIIPGFNPDPTIIRVGEDYFLATSTFEYFPGVPIYHSKDLIKWNLIGHALNRRSQLDIRTPEPGGGIWAPTLRYHKGIFYLTTCSFDRYRPQPDERVWPMGFYVKTDNIWDEKTWSDPVYYDQIGFDQDLFWDDDDTCYLSTTYRKRERTPGSKVKDFAIHVSTIDIETGACTSPPRLVRASKSGVSEGSHLFKRGKYYYLFTAEGGTESGHSEWVHRSDKSPFGPWESSPTNPLWRNTAEDDVQNTGHADIVEDVQGRWWAVFLGVRPIKKDDGWQASVFGKSGLVRYADRTFLIPDSGRETFLVPVTWENDWPVFNHGQKAALTGSGPGMYRLADPYFWRDDFESPELQLGWYRKNVPFKRDYSLTTRPGHLRLHGAAYSLSTPTCPTMLLRKQTQKHTVWRTQLSFKPSSPYVEAGTVVYWNYYTFSSIGLRLANDNTGDLQVRLTKADGVTVERKLQNRQAEVQFVISCSNDGYQFGFREIAGEAEEEADSSSLPWQWLGTVANSIMTRDPPIGAPFTGMMVGLYAIGENEPCIAPADFKFAEFRSA
ncbi:hypothetical protein KEM54_002510 [Ascosphaera aggregata]|nr:hypothetical protein KEM54_002510 [Ascosphaera aggregata]